MHKTEKTPISGHTVSRNTSVHLVIRTCEEKNVLEEETKARGEKVETVIRMFIIIAGLTAASKNSIVRGYCICYQRQIHLLKFVVIFNQWSFDFTQR